MSLARATLSGVLISEPEKRFTSNNIPVTNFTIQVSPVGRSEVPFQVRVTCWRNLADVAAEKLHKGEAVTIEGRLQINQYEAPDGMAKKTYEVDASQIYLGQLQWLAPAFENQNSNSRSQSPDFEPSSGPTQQPVLQGVGVPSGLGGNSENFLKEDLLTEDDIPF